MARSVYSNKLRNRTGRLAQPVRKKPYFLTIAPDVALGYRRNAEGSGSWSVKTAGCRIRPAA